MTPPTEHNRRTDDTRLALLEQAIKATEKRHDENRSSLNAIHKRITDFDYKFDHLADAIIDKVDGQTQALRTIITTERDNCLIREKRIGDIENDIKWIKAWVASAWITISAGIGLIIHRKS